MTEQEIIESNKLIAEFMGIKIINNNIFYESKDVPEWIWRLRLNQQPTLVQHLMYHESWDWLMPVVDKIGEIHFNEKRCVIQVLEAIRSKYLWKYDEKKVPWNEMVNIEELFINVVEYIKWYNKNK